MNGLWEGTRWITADALGLPMAIVGLLSLTVGAWVVVKERARRVSLSFLSMAASTGVYLLGFSAMVRASDGDTALVWAKVAYVAMPLIIPALYQFSMELLGLWRRRLSLVRAAWVVGVVHMTLAVGSDWLVAGVSQRPWGFYTDLTPWNAPFLLWALALTGLALGDYLVAYFGAESVQRARIRWLAIPLLVATTGFIDFLPSFGVDILPLGFVGFLVFLAAASWVVARYHLPDLTPAFAADKIIETMAEPLLVVDELGHVAIANTAAAELLGWARTELEGERLDLVLGRNAAQELLAAPGLGDHEMELASRDGTPIAVSVTTNQLVIKSRPVGTVIAARDIRERRRAAERLRQREEHYRALIENARDTISIMDAEGRMVYRSPSHGAVLGQDPDDPLGKPPFERVHPEDREKAERMFADLAREPGASLDATLRMRHADGTYRIMDIRAQNLLDHPAVLGIVANGRDVTEERQLADRLQQAQKMEAIGRLAGGIAHDFNNVLTSIQGNVALLQEAVPPEPHIQEGLDAIAQGTDRAARLTDELLAFGRRQLTRLEDVAVNDVVSTLEPQLDRIVRDIAPEARLVIDLSEAVGLVRVDRDQLEQAVTDVVMNAAEALDGMGTIEVTTDVVTLDADDTADSPLQPGRHVRVSVADNGIGMDEETRRRIFEPFFSTKEPGSSSGLGLATVYGSIRQASGHIEVESEPGEGTRLSIYLPEADERDPGVARDSDPPAGHESVADDDREAAATPSTGTPTILVVEDEEPVRVLIARVLTREGYLVLDAPDGQAALDAAAAHEGPIDLLVADLVMPGLTGREVAEQMSRDYPDMAIILISGYTADEVVREGISRGDYEFLPKPFDPATLKARVAQALDRR